MTIPQEDAVRAPAHLTDEALRNLAIAAGLPAAISAHPGVKDAMRRAYSFGYGSGQLAELANAARGMEAEGRDAQRLGSEGPTARSA